MSTIKRRKSKADRKEETIPIRCTVEQKQTLAEAAGQLGLPVSGWLLALGLREAKREKAE